MDTGARIKQRRAALGLTQQELATELGVTHQHISRIENGTATPSLALLVALSRRLGVTTDHLLTGSDTPPIELEGAIRAEPDLTPRAKRTLTALVEELRAKSPKA